MKVIAFTVLLALTILTAPLVADAQQPRKVYRIGILAGSSQALNWQPIKEAFHQGLRELGYVEGQNVSLEYRYTEGNVALLPALAADLVRRNVDLIAVGGYAMALAAKQATTTIPIVMTGSPIDPVEAGLVESLARPGGNITGVITLATETAGKLLELFKETVPTLVRVAVFYDAVNPTNFLHAQAVQTAGQALGLAVQLWEVRGPDGFRAGLRGAPSGAPRWPLRDRGPTHPCTRNTHHRLYGPEWVPCGVRGQRVGRGRRADVLHGGSRRPVPTRRGIRGQDSEGYQAGGSAGGEAHEVPPGDQPQDREGPRSHHSPDTALPGRRGDSLSRAVVVPP
jgi:ABC transporter substrate binding protein